MLISRLHYTALILIGLQNSLLTTLEKQSNWGIKAILNRRKYDRFHRSQTSQQNITGLFSLEISLPKIFFFRLLRNDLPANQIEPLSTMRIKHDRSKK